MKKIFITYPNKRPKFIIEPYNNIDFYKYLKKQNLRGHYQIPITSEDLLKIIILSYKKYNYILSNKGIQFFRDDEDYQEMLGDYIQNGDIKIKSNGNGIINKLIQLYRKDSIGITQINMVNYKISSYFYVRNNGIIWCSDKSYCNSVLKIILKVLNDDE